MDITYTLIQLIIPLISIWNVKLAEYSNINKRNKDIAHIVSELNISG